MSRLCLSELQSEFKQFLFTGSNETQLKTLISSVNNISSESRLDVYRNAYYIRLEEALAHDFPALLAAAGDAEFGKLTAGYLQDYPSTSPSLRNLGSYFSAWLKSRGETSVETRGETALADIATMEWSVLNAFDAADATPVQADVLVTIPPENWHSLHFEFHPCVSQIQVNCNARDIWAAVRNETTPIPAVDENVKESLIIWRTSKGPSVQAMGIVEDRVTRNLKQGQSFGDCCLDLATHYPEGEVPQLAAKALALALNSGWIVKISD